MNCCVIFASFAALALSTDAAMCGPHKYFEYKFKPIAVSPVKESEDRDDAHGRCGTVENHCELMIQLAGEKRCTNGRGGNDGIVLKGPDSRNVVRGREFSPNRVDWRTHADWKLSDAQDIPLKIQVCDHDGWLQGGNDQIIEADLNTIQEGCGEYKFQDDHEEHPWYIIYELCCRPLRAEGGRRNNDRGTGSFGSGSSSGSFGGSSSGSFGGSSSGSFGGSSHDRENGRSGFGGSTNNNGGFGGSTSNNNGFGGSTSNNNGFGGSTRNTEQRGFGATLQNQDRWDRES